MLKPGFDYIAVATPFYCNDGKGNFLLHKRGSKARDEVGKWDFGSGKVDFGEDVEKAVLREVKEEYGVIGQIQEQLPAHSIIRTIDGKKSHWLIIPFFVKVDINKAKITETDKFDEMAIFKLPALPHPLHSGVQFTMKKYPQYFKKYQK